MSERTESAVETTPAGRNAPVVAALFLGAAVVSTAALFPPYYRGHPGLAASPEVVLYNLPSLVGWAVAGLLSLDRRAGGFGAALGTALTVLWTPSIIIDIGNMGSAGDTPAAGVLLTCAGLALAIIASGRAFRSGRLGGRAGRLPAGPAVAVAVAGIGYAGDLI